MTWTAPVLVTLSVWCALAVTHVSGQKTPIGFEKRAQRSCYQVGQAAQYRGTLNQTVGGYTCQAWSSQSPHYHVIGDDPEDFIDREFPSNFCRDTLDDWEGVPWCYTTDPDVRWERCDVPVCGDCSAERLQACQEDYQALGDEFIWDYERTCKVFSDMKQCVTQVMDECPSLAPGRQDIRLRWILTKDMCGAGGQGKGYAFLKVKKSWNRAMTICQRRLGGTLAEPRTLQENNFIKMLIETKRGRRGGYSRHGINIWMGGNDRAIEGLWRWGNGEDFSGFTDWDTWNNEPNNGNDIYNNEPNNGNEDCLAMHFQSLTDIWIWNDASCSERRQFVCQTTPEPEV